MRARRAREHAPRRGGRAARGPILRERHGSGAARPSVGSMYQPTASATSRASSSSARRHTSGRPSVRWSVARRSGSAGSETRAFAGKSSANARKRSLAASASTSPESGEWRWVHAAGGNCVPRGDRSRGALAPLVEAALCFRESFARRRPRLRRPPAPRSRRDPRVPRTGESTKSATSRGSPRPGRPTPTRSAGSPGVPSACAIERSPLCPASPPPARACKRPNSRSTSSCTTSTSAGSTLKKRAAAEIERPDSFMYVSGSSSASR